jgi:mono/diheme cytochrome c family protein
MLRINTSRFICKWTAGFLALAMVSYFGVCRALAQAAPKPATAFAQAVAAPAPKPPEPVAWDTLQKEITIQPTNKAQMVFNLTNVSDHEVVITEARGSCHCTVAKLPSQPWHIPPHTEGHIDVSVDLAAKFGSVFKTVTVSYSNTPPTTIPPTVLRIIIHLPEDPNMARNRNQQMASADRQMVFKGDCAKCHADTAKDKDGKELLGKELYVAVCGVCHEANPRATMVSDLHALNHPTNYEYWRQWVMNGKQGTLMPAFAKNQGGPLSDKQIESLAKLLAKAIPSKEVPPAPMTPAAKPMAVKSAALH